MAENDPRYELLEKVRAREVIYPAIYPPHKPRA